MIVSRLLDPCYYDEHDLKDEGFKALGQNARIAKNYTVIGIENIGALSIVNKNLDSWGIYAGCPSRRVRKRSKNLLNMEKDLMEQMNKSIE